jgi:hypothetical protein
MRTSKAISCFFVILLFISDLNHPLQANPGTAPRIIPKFTSKVRVDGILDEKLWQESLVLTLNYEVEPGENIAPPVQTEILLATGPAFLYVGFRAYDPKSSEIRARVTDRDNIWEDDYVGIILDTFNDSRNTYNFYCNPLGIQADQVMGAIGDDEYDAIWDSAGHITKSGYTVEMAIPFSSLRFQESNGRQIWRIDAVRNFPRNLTHTLGLFARDRNNNCYMCQAVEVIGFSGAKAGKNLEFDPTLSALVTHERDPFPGGKLSKKTGKVDPGLTARWRITPNITLSSAINPDFSQVEADAAQLDINTQFALYYPEKRPFFLEGTGIFRSPTFRVIYSRAVADPNWGIKLTGKEKKYTFGFFTVQDNITNLLFPGTYRSRSTSINKKNISTVLRVLYDVGKSSNLGIVITDREGEDYFNRLIGLDGNLKITAKDLFTIQLVSTQTHYPDEIVSQFNQPQGRFSGTALDLFYQHKTRQVDLWCQYQDITPNYRADLGLGGQTGYRTRVLRGAYTWWHNPGHWYSKINIGSQYLHETDREGTLLLQTLQSWIKYYGPQQSYVRIGINLGRKSFMGVEFDDRYVDFDVSLYPTGSLMLSLNGYFGDQVDIANVQAGKQLSFNPVLQYKIGRHLFAGLDHVYERLNVSGGRLYTANLSNIRLIYQINRRAFFRVILQYADSRYNPDLYGYAVDPLERHLFSQVLFSYKINPRTVLFLGYSDNYSGSVYIPLTQANRTLFLKVGYALVL